MTLSKNNTTQLDDYCRGCVALLWYRTPGL